MRNIGQSISAKVMTPIGKAFAEAMVNMRKNP